MIRNYLKIAFRNLIRNKSYSAINILGLALGVGCCLLLTLYILDEVSYDKHHHRLNDLYRITSHFQSERGLDNLGTTSPPIAGTLKDEIPEIETFARVINPPGVAQNLIKYEGNIFYETNGFVADSTVFDVFNYQFKEGNPGKALTQANTVVITETLAKKLFGNEPALDKMISISQGGAPTEFKITGVFIENHKSFIDASFFVSMMSAGWGEYIRNEKEWAGQNFVPAFVRLVPGHDEATVEKKMNEVLLKHGEQAMKALGIHKTLALEPVKDVYLKSDIGQSPRIRYLYVIASIAIFILLIACINFMNLSTAKATKRAAEIGIRKTMGAFRSSLVKQILGEAMLIVVIAIVIGIVFVQLILPSFNEVTGKTISINPDNLPSILLASLILIVITGLVAGSYPAFYLSSFQPAQVLKGKLNMGNSSGLLRQSLVVVQFVIAIALTCGIFIISDQLTFMQEKNLGFDAHAKIVLPLRTKNAQRQYDALKKELLQNSNVKAVSACDYTPGSRIWSDMMFYPDGGNMDKAILNQRNNVDVGFVEMLGIKLLAGRSFTDNRAMDSQFKVMVNQKSAEKLGFTPEKAIGEKVHFDWRGKKYDFEIIGVMENFHQTSLHDEITPIMFELTDSTTRYGYMIASVASTKFEETVKSIEKTWKAQVTDTPFEYSFLDKNIQKQYEEDKKISKIITSFGVMAMIICSLGLYGLSSYMAERRFKEIGIRKVMGASVNQIVTMMSAEFVKLVLIAFVIALPLAWYGMTRWLEGFAYRVPVSWMVFVLAGLAALSIALITVSFESVKSAMSNPVDSLRSE
ncbi:MAG: ABC transporter permease [Bacteroidetes bacterium]|nr:ABC transporter permease [Bacteroidota bacterium]